MTSQLINGGQETSTKYNNGVLNGGDMNDNNEPDRYKNDDAITCTTNDDVDGVLVQKLKRLGFANPTNKQQKWTENMQANPWVFEYNMEKRGRAFLFNNIDFDRKATGMRNRNGADNDADSLFDAFSRLNFKVSTHINCTLATTHDIIDKAARADYSQYSCLVIVFMSHGDDGILYATDGHFRVDSLTVPFKGNACPSLVGKPKLFFIQACRGQTFDEAVEVDNATDEPDIATDEPDSRSTQELRQKIPAEADVLLAYACPPNFYSFRSTVDGAWFIEALEFVLKTYATDRLEIQQMLTRVCHIVAYEYESRTDREETSGKKQVPYIVSTLTKSLYLTTTPEK